MIGGIIVTHGPMAQALIKAAETILGKVTYTYGFSTTDLALPTIIEKIGQIIQSDDWTAETLILVSLKGGSCWHAAVTTKKQHQHVEVISGVNLSMLLSFLTKREAHQLPDLTTLVLQDGIRGIEKY
ncbi:hypothetical protein L0Z72_16300 [candidate division KSB1 bacterium]|jgi:mannose/fructose-specific phosphotransferase system component IIA|nr:hypothetical protein [candidate division KSB1 bacterium]